MIKIKIRISCTLLLMIAYSCQKNIEQKTNPEPSVSVNKSKNLTKEHKVYTSAFLKIEDALINGHKIMLTIDDFNATYKSIDSSRTDLWECGNPLEWLDSEWMTKTYGKRNEEIVTYENFDGKFTTMYVKNIEYNTNQHSVLFDTALMQSNTFEIKHHSIILNGNTTAEAFQKKFPKAEMETTDVPNEVRFRMYLNEKNIDSFLFYFKDGKLDSIKLWWELC